MTIINHRKDDTIYAYFKDLFKVTRLTSIVYIIYCYLKSLGSRHFVFYLSQDDMARQPKYIAYVGDYDRKFKE